MSWIQIGDVNAHQLYDKIREQLAAAAEQATQSSFLPVLRDALSGAGGTAFSNVAIYPLDVVVKRLQVQKKSSQPASSSSSDDDDFYTSIPDAFHKIYTTEGVYALFSGVVDDTIKDVSEAFLFFLAYNGLWRLRSRYPFPSNPVLAFLDELVLGSAAGAFSKGVTLPVQTLVVQKQINRSAHKPSNLELAREVYRSKGLVGFWAGYSVVLVLTMNPALTFFLDSALRKAFKVSDKPGMVATFLVAATGKGAASAITYPLSLAKSRAQAESTKEEEKEGEDRPPSTVVMTVPYIARKEGIGALYAGMGGEVLKGFLSHGLTMMVKDNFFSYVIRLYYVLSSLLLRRRSQQSKG